MMYAAPANGLWAQQLHETTYLRKLNYRWSKCAGSSQKRAARSVPCLASSNVASRPSQLDINTEGDVYSKFGMPGDYVKQGKWPYGGLVKKRDRHDGLYGKGRYLVQNKGLVLGAIDDPLPKMAGGNETEQAIILAIAMQESDWMDASDLKVGRAENKSCLNVCVDMLDKTQTDWRNKDATVELHGVVGCLLLWLRGKVSVQQGRTEHLKDTLNFVRGGGSAFAADGRITFPNAANEKDTSDYINAVASIYRELRKIAPAGRAGQWDDTMGVSKGADKDIPTWDSANLWANNSRIRIDIKHI